VATAPDLIRGRLVTVTEAVAKDLADVATSTEPDRAPAAVLAALPLIVPSYYDAAGALAVDWYDELRDAARPTTRYAPTSIGDPTTDWIEREVAKFQKQLSSDLNVEEMSARLVDEITALTEKEVAYGFRDSILGNTRQDQDALGWSRVARPGGCKFCVMLASNDAWYRREATATFAAHKNCHCAAQPVFRNGARGPEASVVQYLAQTSSRTPAERAKVRAYLNKNFPDAPG